MRSPSFSYIINLGLLLSVLFAMFSGLLLQVEYHIGNHISIQTDKIVLGASYCGWSTIHKISIVLLSFLMIFHVNVHWKWYCIVIRKGLFRKNIQVLTLTILFILVAATGFIPWIIHLQGGNIMVRKTFIEIHDKIAIILTIYIILHIIKRLRWFLTAFEKIKNNK